MRSAEGCDAAAGLPRRRVTGGCHGSCYPPLLQLRSPLPFAACLHLQVGLSWLLAAVQTLTAVVWACLDPLRHLPDQVACTKPDDQACIEALASGALCSLPRETWAWRSP